MAQPTSRFRVLSGILAVGQLGISLIVPILLFTGLGVYLTERFSVGAWLTVLCVVVGVVTAGCTFYHVAREFLARMRAEDKPCPGTTAAGETGAETDRADALRAAAAIRTETNGADAAPSKETTDADAASPAESTGAGTVPTRLLSGDTPTDHRHPGGDHT